jgi:NRPS condensation-like uncharacterized protein
MNSIPRRFPSRTVDRGVSLLGYAGDMMIQLELEFAEQLDAERLARAFDLTLDAEPVLGCRFVDHWRRPYWERLNERERETFLLTEEQGEYEAFKTSSLDAYAGPQIKACVWRSSNRDRLLLKVSHVVADAGGVKEIASSVASTYSRLTDEPTHRPVPNTGGSRSLWQVMRRVPWYAYPKIYLNHLRDSWSNWVPTATHTVPLEDGPRTPLVFVCRLLHAEWATYLAEYGRARHATVNDVMIAAFYRALVVEGDWNGQSQLRLRTTADLRRYLPSGRAAGICNLSAWEYANLGTDLGDDFDSTLARVTAITRRRKANWIGLSDCLGTWPALWLLPHCWTRRLFRQIVEQAIKERKIGHALTNMGPIDPDSVTFGARPVNAWLLVPPTYPPLLVAGMSGYAGTLTLSAGVYPTQEDIIERFLDRILGELPTETSNVLLDYAADTVAPEPIAA